MDADATPPPPLLQQRPRRDRPFHALSAAAGGRLPTISELIAFVLRPGKQVEEQAWSGDLADTSGSTEVAFTSDENGREARDGASVEHGYRCVFLPTN